MRPASKNGKRHDVLRLFSGAGAFSPDTACPAEAVGVFPKGQHRRAVCSLVRRGTLVKTGPDAFYIDRTALHTAEHKVDKPGLMHALFAAMLLMLSLSLLDKSIPRLASLLVL